MKFPKIKQQQKKSLLAVESLLSVIARYNVGDKLPPERLLAHEMDISRNTLREAIAALQVMGIIEVRHSQGNFIVALPEPATLQTALASIFQSDPFSIVDARAAFEPGVAFFAAQRRTEDDLQRLRVQLERLVASMEANETEGYAEADFQFHLHIAKATHNELIVETLTPLVSVVKTPLWQAMKKGLDRNVFLVIREREHMAIFEHIAHREALKASECMSAHLAASKERFLLERE